MKFLPLLLGVGLVIYFLPRFIEDLKFFKRDRRGWLADKWENWVKPLVIAAVLAIGIRSFIIGPYKIPTGSMRPVLMEGDRIFVDKITYRFRAPRRGEVIVFRYPLDRKKDFVKRLAGLGGETLEIRDGQLYVDGEHLVRPGIFEKIFYYNREDWAFAKRGQKIEVPGDYYFALGDNSAQSSDSRNWGFVPKKDVIGRAVLIWWPPKRVRLLNRSNA